MSEKPTEKPKVRKVIFSGVLSDSGQFVVGPSGSCTNIKTLTGFGFPDGTPIECVVLVDVEPERKLVRPEGVSLVVVREDDCETFEMIAEGRSVAVIEYPAHGQFQWVIEGERSAIYDNIFETITSTEEALADAGLYGFGWEEELIADCEDCGRPYGSEHGFPDLVLPNDMFAKISSTGDENGMFCPSCIVARCVKASIECEATWRSGPFCQNEKLEEKTQYTAWKTIVVRKNGHKRYWDWTELENAKNDFAEEVASGENKTVCLKGSQLVELERHDATENGQG